MDQSGTTGIRGERTPDPRRRRSRRRALAPAALAALALALALATSVHARPPDAIEPGPIEDVNVPFIAPAGGFDWRVPTRFHRWDDAWTPWSATAALRGDAETYDPAYVHPTEFPMDFDGCPTADEATRAEAQEPTQYTYAWAVEGETFPPRRDCFFRHVFHAQGLYSATLTIEDADGNAVLGSPFRKTVQVKDILIVTLGDSYASGEGNPDVPRSENAGPEWIDDRCHRSATAGPTQAARLIEASDPKTSVTYLSFACSGATVDRTYYSEAHLLDPYDQNTASAPFGSGILGPYAGAADPTDPTADPDLGFPLLPSQIDQLRRAITTGGVRSVDAVTVSGGGNDIGFGPLASVCVLTSPRCYEARVGPADEKMQLRDRFARDLAAMPESYAELQRKLAELAIAPDDVYITEYPDPTTNERGETCAQMLEDAIPPLPWSAALLGLWPLVVQSHLFPLSIAGEEVTWARTTVLPGLNRAVQEGAEANRWQFVDGIAAPFAGHGYCSTDNWIRRAAESTALQGPPATLGLLNNATKGTLHPTARGHAVYRDRLFEEMAPNLRLPSDAPTAPPSFQVSTTMGGVSSRAGANGWLVGPAVLTVEATTTTSIANPNGILTQSLSVNGMSGCSVGLVCTSRLVDPQTQRWTVAAAHDGIYRIEAAAGDWRGQTSTFSYELKVDLHDPDVSATPTAAGERLAGWYTTAVDVTLGGTDPPGGSGIAAVEYDLDGAGFVRGADGETIRLVRDGLHSLTVRAVDRAGRTGAARTITIPINRSVANGKIAYQSTVNGSEEIFVMNANGSGQTNLTNDPAGAGQSVADRDPAWSPDGSRIAFARPSEGHVNVYVMNADGSGRQNLTPGPSTTGQANTGNEPSWSPDGTQIAFNSGGNVWVMNADGSGKTNLTGDDGPAGRLFGNTPAWSPDGSKIAYGRAADIWVMNADGSAPTQLTTSTRGEFRPDWSPDGSKIAYHNSGDGQVWVMNADGSGQTQLTGDAVGEGGREPSWSPDGTKIVFSSSGNGAPNGPDIFVMNADGTSITRLDTPVPAIDVDPSWQSVALPTVTIADATVPEGDTGRVAAALFVELSEPSSRTVTVAYATEDASASAPGDYVGATGTLTFAPGETRQTVAVDVVGDTLVENSESFVVALSAATNAETADGQGVATIADDDVLGSDPPADTVAPTLSLPSDMTAEATGPDGARVTYTVSATDGDGPAPTVSCSPESGSLFPVGTTTVTCTATDAAGNQAGGSFDVLVTELIGPPLVAIAEELTAIVNAHPDTPLADKVEDALAKVEAALAKLARTPADRQGALGELEGAVADIEAAVADGLLPASDGTSLMDRISSSPESTGAAREIAEAAISEALSRHGDAAKISEAQGALAEGDSKRVSGRFKDAIARYKDAVSKAEGA